MTNSPWRLSLSGLRRQLGSGAIHVINDFAAIAWTVPALARKHWRQIGGGRPVAGKPCVVAGPGTGLGTATVAYTGKGYVILEGQGGHTGFAPATDLEIELLKRLRLQFPRVSAERLLSGQGLVNIYRALADIEGKRAALERADAITRRAMENRSGLAHNTLSVFCAVLGSVAGDLALSAGARGGVYLGGGIVNRISDFLAGSDFRKRFEDKGRYSGYNAKIPTRIITLDNPGLAGAAMYLRQLV